VDRAAQTAVAATIAVIARMISSRWIAFLQLSNALTRFCLVPTSRCA
jgi:hypothetical protein